MNPGLLNKRVTFLKDSTAQNSLGESIGEPENIATVWARVEPLQGRELYQALQVHSEAQTKLTVRFRRDIKPSLKVKYGERVLQIISPPINVNEQNRFLEILCKEVDSNGQANSD